MSRRVLVLNPNSNDSVTRGMARSLEPLAEALGLVVDCHTLPDAPFGIESEDDIAAVGPLVVDWFGHHGGYAAYIIACYSDPGLEAARAQCPVPVFGIHESAVRHCADRGWRFGVLALGPASIDRHVAYVAGLGFADLHAGEQPMYISVDQAANDPQTLDRIVAGGRTLIDETGADCVVLGCAGLAAWRDAAEQALGVPVIDPVIAAVAAASAKA
jgi:Asp/Glu/hydantoin racemase